MYKYLWTSFLLSCFHQLTGQELTTSKTPNHKNTYFFTWGYNRSWYAPSDIHFSGLGYDFTLIKARAHDTPNDPTKELFKTYLNPVKISIPQFNFRFGYFIKPTLSISVGWDHMKYVVDRNQYLKIDGYINPFVSEPSIATGSYAGTYSSSGEKVPVTRDLLAFEHTDGYNYVTVEADHYGSLWTKPTRKMSLEYTAGVGLGPVVPRSDVRLFGVGANHFWNIAGFGGSIKAAVILNFNRFIYFEAAVKGGSTRLSNIQTTGRNHIDKAEQTISFFETFGTLGFRFNTGKNTKL